MNHAARLVGHAQDAIVTVELLPQVALELEVLGEHGLAEPEQRRRAGANVLHAGRTRLGDGLARGVDQVVDDEADHAPHDLVHQPPAADARVPGADEVELPAEDLDPAQVVDADEPGTQAVVDVVGVVGDLVGEVRELRLERRLAAFEEPLAEFAELPGVRGRAVLQDALAGLEGQVQARELGVALLELVHDAQRLQVMLEAPELPHAFVQRVLPGMPERRVSEVVREADGLRKRLVQPQRAGDAAGDLRHLERMG